jgi:hypothetical protein
LIEIQSYDSSSPTYRLYSKILDNVELSNDLDLSNRESLFIKDICKRIEKSKTVLYILKNDDDIIGLVALAATSIKDQPSVQIDYIFVSQKYRGQRIEQLDNCKPFKYLIDISVNIAKDFKSAIGLRYLVLSPDNDDLKEKYKQVNFQKLDNDWMYLKI